MKIFLIEENFENLLLSCNRKRKSRMQTKEMQKGCKYFLNYGNQKFLFRSFKKRRNIDIKKLSNFK